MSPSRRDRRDSASPYQTSGARVLSSILGVLHSSTETWRNPGEICMLEVVGKRSPEPSAVPKQGKPCTLSSGRLGNLLLGRILEFNPRQATRRLADALRAQRQGKTRKKVEELCRGEAYEPLAGGMQRNHETLPPMVWI